jgi:PAS domain S-box-containing protein
MSDPPFSLSEAPSLDPTFQSVPPGLQLRMARIVAALPDAILCIDRSWHMTYANQEAIRISRLRPDLFASADFWQTYPNLVGTEIERRYRTAMASGQPDHFEHYYEPFDTWVDIRILPTDEGLALVYRDITEQRTDDNIVRTQQELLGAVQRVSRLATWELDIASGQIVYGPGAFEVYGHPLTEVATLAQLEQHMLPGHAERRRKRIAESIATGKSMLMEFGVVAADGSTVWVESRGQAVKPPGASPRFHGISIDITQRHLDQQDLVASEARYRVLADLNPQAIWMGDPQGNITYANQGFLAYIGLTTETLNSGWLDAFAPVDRKRVGEVWTRSVTTGVDFDVEALIRHIQTGEHRYWHLRAAPVRDASGAILHWLGVGQDIHDTKTYTAALRFEQMETERRRAELETIYKTTPIGLALLDPVDFRFLNLNDQEAAMIGLPKDQILGRPLAEIAPIPGLLELLRSVAKGNEIKDHLLVSDPAEGSGKPRFWSVNYSPIYNESGAIRAISSATIEITNQKKAEAALIQSEKLAAVGRLASSISHEINNPLEAITNLLFLISLDHDLPEQLKTYVHMAQSELSRVSQIATQTLRFHRQAVAPTLVAPAELVDAVIRLYTGRLMNSNIKVDAHYPTETRILCFENDIRQVLNNLIANAIDAMRNGGRLIVRAHDALLHSASGTSPGIRITIADTGHGMSPTILTRIFEPFFTTKDLNGTGLGLWISAGIIERHQGRIRVRSSDRPDLHGTVFSLFLPCKEDPSSEPS